MKILHILLNEYDTLAELQKAFYEMDAPTGNQLSCNKKQAEANLQYQYDKYKSEGAKVFWWKNELFEGRETFVMYEALFD